MNINEGALDDIPALDDQSVIKAPGTVDNSVKPAVTIIADAPVGLNSVVAPQDLAKLPGMDVTLKLIEEGQKKVVSLQDIQNDIIGEDVISQEGASYLNLHFEGLLDGQVKLPHFTTGKSKANLDFVKRYMKRTISNESCEVSSKFQMMLSQPLADHKDLFDKTIATYIPAVRDQFAELQYVIGGREEEIMGSKNTVFPYGEGSFFNITKDKLASIDASKIGNIPDDIKGSIASMLMALKDPIVYTFIRAAMNGKTEDIMSKDFHPTYMGDELSLGDLIQFYKSGADKFLDEVTRVCEEQFKVLEELSKDSSKFIGSDEVTQQAISTVLPQVQLSFTIIRRAMCIIDKLSIVNFNSRTLIDFIVKNG